MHGPDYDLAGISDWRVADGRGYLALSDGSRWMIATSEPAFAGVRAMIETAQQMNGPIFVSGDRSTGRFDDVALPQLLRPMEVADKPIDGRLRVIFYGPPSAYYLNVGRPWFATARNLLQRRIALQTPSRFPPELLITVDVTTMEIMDVREP